MSQKSSEDGWRGFLELCCQVKSPKEMAPLFDLVFTIEEKQALAARYQILKALVEGKLTQREIAKHYQVSIAQITRGSNALKIISDKLRGYLEKNLK